MFEHFVLGTSVNPASLDTGYQDECKLSPTDKVPSQNPTGQSSTCSGTTAGRMSSNTDGKPPPGPAGAMDTLATQMSQQTLWQSSPATGSPEAVGPQVASPEALSASPKSPTRDPMEVDQASNVRQLRQLQQRLFLDGLVHDEPLLAGGEDEDVDMEEILRSFPLDYKEIRRQMNSQSNSNAGGSRGSQHRPETAHRNAPKSGAGGPSSAVAGTAHSSTSSQQGTGEPSSRSKAPPSPSMPPPLASDPDLNFEDAEPLEIDEGFCEGGEWDGNWPSVAGSSIDDSALRRTTAANGIRKYPFKYRNSTEVALSCANIVPNRTRMRRRVVSSRRSTAANSRRRGESHAPQSTTTTTMTTTSPSMPSQ